MRLPLIIGMALTSAPAIPLSAMAQPQPTADIQQVPGFYRFKVGSYVVTALSDGTATIPWEKILQGMTSDRIRSNFAAVGEATTRDTSINAYLVDTGTRRILIDAGSGSLFGDCCGKLPSALAAAGYPVDTIDTVLLTHVHGDHSGGLSIDGRRVFPNADVYLARGEYEYWMSDAEQARAKISHKKMFAEGRAALAPYDAAGRLRFFTGKTTLFPGITAIPAPGHTPGHSLYRIASGSNHFLIVGDIIHVAEVQFPHPEVTADFDANPAQARSTRARILAELARSHELIAADHVSFPGLGHVMASGKGYAWTARPYQAAIGKAAQ